MFKYKRPWEDIAPSSHSTIQTVSQELERINTQHTLAGIIESWDLLRRLKLKANQDNIARVCHHGEGMEGKEENRKRKKK